MFPRFCINGCGEKIAKKDVSYFFYKVGAVLEISSMHVIRITIYHRRWYLSPMLMTANYKEIGAYKPTGA